MKRCMADYFKKQKDKKRDVGMMGRESRREVLTDAADDKSAGRERPTDDAVSRSV